MKTGDRVIIKSRVASWARGQWGIIKDFDGIYYHIAIYNDVDMILIFTRDEIRKERTSKGGTK